MDTNLKDNLSHRLIQAGLVLFLLGLLTGFVIPLMANPRMGLSSHLEGVMNGMFLILIGLVWPRLHLPERAHRWGYLLALIGTYTNWATTLLAGFWGAGAAMMPIAGGGMQGAVWQELLIKAGLAVLSLAMVVVCGLVLWGLRRRF